MTGFASENTLRLASREAQGGNKLAGMQKDRGISFNADTKADMEGKIDYPRQGSNLRPFAPEANALIH